MGRGRTSGRSRSAPGRPRPLEEALDGCEGALHGAVLPRRASPPPGIEAGKSNFRRRDPIFFHFSGGGAFTPEKMASAIRLGTTAPERAAPASRRSRGGLSREHRQAFAMAVHASRESTARLAAEQPRALARALSDFAKGWPGLSREMRPAPRRARAPTRKAIECPTRGHGRAPGRALVGSFDGLAAQPRESGTALARGVDCPRVGAGHSPDP